MKMKRVLSAVLSLTILMFLSACGSSSSEPDVADLFASGETFYFANDKIENPRYTMTLVEGEENQVKLENIKKGSVHSFTYTVEEMGDNIYRYNIDCSNKENYSVFHDFPKMNVIALDTGYAFVPVTEKLDNEESTYDETKELFESGMGYYVYLEKEE